MVALGNFEVLALFMISHNLPTSRTHASYRWDASNIIYSNRKQLETYSVLYQIKRKDQMDRTNMKNVK
jgi:hypothetical protein